MQSRKGPSHTLLHENVEIDRDSAFRVFRGEELHPNVKFIRFIAGTDCSNEVVFLLLKLCLGYLLNCRQQTIVVSCFWLSDCSLPFVVCLVGWVHVW